MSWLFDLIRLFQSRDFYHFQSQLSRSWYSALIEEYTSGYREEHLVESLVNAAETMTLPKKTIGLKIASKFIHGHRSQVKYQDFNGQILQCELGDMAIVSAVIDRKEIVFMRLCFIQNKKGKHNRASITWAIDMEQLFLLKHFPPITGVCGILKGFRNVEFTNRSRCLGAYGLLCSPGEMTFVSAPLLADIMKGKKSINSMDIAFPPAYPCHMVRHHCHVCGCFEPFDFPFFSLPYCSIRPVCGNSIFSRDIHDFIVAWTQLNIGEILCCAGNIVDDEAYRLATAMVNAVFPGSIDGPFADGQPVEIPDNDTGMGIFVYLVDISQRWG